MVRREGGTDRTIHMIFTTDISESSHAFHFYEIRPEASLKLDCDLHQMSFSNRLLRQFIHDFKPCRPHHRVYSKCTSLRSSNSSLPQPLSRLPRHPPRTFSTSTAVRASLASHPPAQPTELIYYPTPESLPPPEDPDDPEVEFIPPEEAQLEMTERAAEACASLVLQSCSGFSHTAPTYSNYGVLHNARIIPT